MAQWKALGASLGTGTVIALLMSTTAQAEVTAEQVWKSWMDFSTSMGQTMAAGSQEMAGDTLTVSNVVITAKTATGSVEGSIESVAFKEMGDGTVEVTMSPEFPLAITEQVEGADPVEIKLTLKQSGMKLLVSGSDAELGTALSADSLTMVLDGVSAATADVQVDVSMAMNGIAGTYGVKNGDAKEVTSDFSASGMTIDVKVVDPAQSSDFAMNGTIEGITSNGTTTIPKTVDFTDMTAALAAGFATKGAATFGKGTYAFDFKDATSSGNLAGTVESGAFDVAMNDDALTYQASEAGVDFKLMSSDLPIPEVSLKMAEAAFGMMMPLGQSTEPKDFSFLTKVVGLAVSDEIWGMFDPGAVLPRDPATLIIDVTGKANWLIDIFKQDPANPTTEVPGQIHALTLKQLQLTAAGVDLSASGDFTFDNTDMVTYEGMPKPVGTLDAKLIGGNGLIDKLIQMGILPEDQAMGGRMMMGMFATAVEGQEDTITSNVEMKEDGSVFANGQQIK